MAILTHIKFLIFPPFINIVNFPLHYTRESRIPIVSSISLILTLKTSFRASDYKHHSGLTDILPSFMLLVKL